MLAYLCSEFFEPRSHVVSIWLNDSWIAKGGGCPKLLLVRSPNALEIAQCPGGVWALVPDGTSLTTW